MNKLQKYSTWRQKKEMPPRKQASEGLHEPREERVAGARVFVAKPSRTKPVYEEMRRRAKARFSKTLDYLAK
jgi:hypothetical protein